MPYVAGLQKHATMRSFTGGCKREIKQGEENNGTCVYGN